MKECGLVQFYLRRRSQVRCQRKPTCRQSTIRPFDNNDVKLPFYLLFTGHLTSFTVLIIEVLFTKYLEFKQKNLHKFVK